MKIFKVVKPMDGIYISPWIGKDLRVEYKPDIDTISIETKPLFGFNTLGEANKWKSELSLFDTVTFEAEAEIVQCQEFKNKLTLPLGTVFCKLIRILKIAEKVSKPAFNN